MYTRKVIFILLWIVIITGLVACSGEHEVKSVKTINIKKEKYQTVCPFCRKKRLIQDFKDTPVPNMKRCP